MAEQVVPGTDERSGAGVEARIPASDIARRRAARDLWISKSHLAAGVALAFAFSALTFAGGVQLGKRWATPAVAVTPSLTAEVPRDELLRLLARIDGNASGPAAALTFPDALRGQSPPAGDAAAEVPGPTTLVAGGTPAVTGDVLPGAGWTVVLSTTPSEADARAHQSELGAAGIRALVGAELVEGSPRYRVVVGQFAQRDDAVAAARLLAAAGTPVVESLLPAPPTAPEPEPEVVAPTEPSPTEAPPSTP
jgi:hypothetical protein